MDRCYTITPNYPSTPCPLSFYTDDTCTIPSLLKPLFQFQVKKSIHISHNEGLRPQLTDGDNLILQKAVDFYARFQETFLAEEETMIIDRYIHGSTELSTNILHSN